jgi:hypothetical protein
MALTYNFTARATSALGASADRAFSITVNNSIIQRLVVVSQSGAARALTAGGTWAAIPGVKGDSVAWGDRWLIWDQVAGVMWRSPDAINWASLTPTLPGGYTTLSHMRWRAGAWWALGGDGTNIGVLTSTNGGATWTLVGAAQLGAFAASFERTEGGASVIANGSDWYYRATDGGAWVPVKTFGASGAKFQIAHLNGVWFGPSSNASSPGFARSADGSAWFDQSNASVLTAGYYRGFAYLNGAVVGHSYFDALSGYTTDAGITVSATNALPAASDVFNTDSPIVAQAGRVAMIGDTGRTFAVIGATGTWTAQTIPGGWQATSIAARN